MAAVRGCDNIAELALRRELSKRGLRYRLRPGRVAGNALPGRPDIVFVGARVIVFVDGDFWHGRVLLRRGRQALAAQFRAPLRKWWVAKIEGNAQRDVRVTAELRRRGWLVFRFWESAVLQSPNSAADKIERAVSHRT